MAKYQPKYWNGNGQYQKEMDSLFEKLVPNERDANTELGQIIRYVSKLHYDIYNNGGGNFDHEVMIEAKNYLKYRVGLFYQTAKELGVNGFYRKYHAFLNNQASAKSIDDVVDVVVKYVMGQYDNHKTSSMKLIEASKDLLEAIDKLDTDTGFSPVIEKFKKAIEQAKAA